MECSLSAVRGDSIREVGWRMTAVELSGVVGSLAEHLASVALTA